VYTRQSNRQARHVVGTGREPEGTGNNGVVVQRRPTESAAANAQTTQRCSDTLMADVIKAAPAETVTPALSGG